eukprot:SAG11_NODE_938_length_6471_cov_4.156780_7_plen_172_part_00
MSAGFFLTVSDIVRKIKAISILDSFERSGLIQSTHFDNEGWENERQRTTQSNDLCCRSCVHRDGSRVSNLDVRRKESAVASERLASCLPVSLAPSLIYLWVWQQALLDAMEAKLWGRLHIKHQDLVSLYALHLRSDASTSSRCSEKCFCSRFASNLFWNLLCRLTHAFNSM